MNVIFFRNVLGFSGTCLDESLGIESIFAAYCDGPFLVTMAGIHALFEFRTVAIICLVFQKFPGSRFSAQTSKSTRVSAIILLISLPNVVITYFNVKGDITHRKNTYENT